MGKETHAAGSLLLVLGLSIAANMGPFIQPSHAQGFPSMMDRDQDGTINFSEWKGPPERFRMFDRDGDGFITEEEFKRVRTQIKAGPSRKPDRAAGHSSSPPRQKKRTGSKPAFMTEAEIRTEIIGNTAKFTAPKTGRPMRVHFAHDGTAAVATGDNAKKIIAKSWRLASDGTLCRTVGQQNGQHCTRIRRGPTNDIFIFVLKQNRYRVKLLDGRRLRAPAASANR